MALGYLIQPFIQVQDINGTPVVGARVYVYEADTTDFAVTYRDFDGHRNENPIITDELGNFTVVADSGILYDMVINDADGNLLFSKKQLSVNFAGSDGSISVQAGTGISVGQSGNTYIINVDTDYIATQEDLATKQDRLYAGDNISIVDNIISSTYHDTTYTATAPLAIDSSNHISIMLGTGLTTQNSSLALDTSYIATQANLGDYLRMDHIVAGANMSIPNNSSYITFAATDTKYTFSTGLTENAGIVIVDNPVPAASSSDNGKLLGVTNSLGNIGWISLPANLVQDAAYVHTDNNFTDSLKSKLDGIEAGATKVLIPNNPSQSQPLTLDSYYLHFHWGSGLSCYTPTGGVPQLIVDPTITTKLAGIEAGAQVNVQADWNQTSTSADDYIKNKPTIPIYSAGDGIGISSGVISRKVQFVTPSSTYSTIRHVLDEGDVPVLDVANGSYHNYFFPTHKSGTHVDFIGSMGYTTYPTYEAADYMLKYSVDDNNSWTVTKYHELPDYTSSDASKALVVNSGGTGVEWSTPTATLFEAVYGQTTYSEVNDAVTAKKIVYCRISSTGASRMAFLAYKGTSNYEFQYYRSVSSHTDTQQGDEVYVYTVSSSGSTAAQQWSTTTRQTFSKVIAGTGLSSSFTAGTSSSITLNVDTPIPAYNSTVAGDILAVNSAGTGVEWIDNQVPAYTSADQYKVLSVGYNGNSTQWRDVREVPSYAVANQGYLLGVVNNGGTVELGWTQPTGYWTQAVDNSGNHTLTAEDITAGYVDFETAITASNTSSAMMNPTYAALSWDVRVSSGSTSSVVSSIDFSLGISGGSYETIFSDNNPAHEVHKDWGITKAWLLNYRKNRVRARCNLASGATVGNSIIMNCGGIVIQVR